MNINMNTTFWGNLKADNIPGNNIYPGDELFSLLKPQAKILDVGCGSGQMAEFLSKKGNSVTAIDINKDTISKNHNKRTQVNYLLADVTINLPFEDHFFDAAIFAFVLVNLTPLIVRERAIKEISRILKPGGIIWLNEGVVSPEYKIRYSISENIIHEKNSFFVYSKRGLSKNIQTEQQLRDAFKNRQIERISHHFTEDELLNLFKDFRLIYKKDVFILSPRSKSKVEALTLILQKK